MINVVVVVTIFIVVEVPSVMDDKITLVNKDHARPFFDICLPIKLVNRFFKDWYTYVSMSTHGNGTIELLAMRGFY